MKKETLNKICDLRDYLETQNFKEGDKERNLLDYIQHFMDEAGL